jgi:quinoprotein glucose dehydrogenase
MVVTRNLLMYAADATDGTPQLFAVDKASGKQVGKVEVPDQSSYGMMTYVHEGKQYVLLQTGGKLTTMALAD